MAIQSAFYFTDGTTRTFPSTKHIASSANVAVWMKRVVDDVWELTSYELWTLANNSIVFTVAPQSTVYSQIELRIADEYDELIESPSNIALVAGSIANVDTVATNISAVNTVSTNITAVQNTSANATNINTVSTNIANVNTVATNIANVNTTASNIANVNAVASDLLEPISEINTVATDIANVNTVGLAITAVNTVATSIANVNSVATTIVPNIAEILLADDNAIIATTKANEASASAAASASSASASASSATSASNSATTATAQAGIATTKAGEASASSISSATSATNSEASYQNTLAIYGSTQDVQDAVSLSTSNANTSISKANEASSSAISAASSATTATSAKDAIEAYVIPTEATYNPQIIDSKINALMPYSGYTQVSKKLDNFVFEESSSFLNKVADKNRYVKFGDKVVDTYGPELVTNGDFSDGTAGWDTTTGITYNDYNIITSGDGSFQRIIQYNNPNFVVGDYVLIKVDTSNNTKVGIHSTTNAFGSILFPKSGELFVKLASDDLMIYTYHTSPITINNISVKEIQTAQFQVPEVTEIITDGSNTTSVSVNAGDYVVDGSELVTNGTFDSDTDWTKGTGWTISGGVLTSSGSSDANVSQILSDFSSNKKYCIEYEITSYTSGFLRFFSNGVWEYIPNTVGKHTVVLSGNSTNTISFLSPSASVFIGSIDNISVKRVSDTFRAIQDAPIGTALTDTAYFEDRTEIGVTNQVVSYHAYNTLTNAYEGIKTETLFSDVSKEDLLDNPTWLARNGFSKVSDFLYSKGSYLVLPVGIWQSLNKGAYHPVFNGFGTRRFSRDTDNNGLVDNRINWYENYYYTPKPISTADVFTYGYYGDDGTYSSYYYDSGFIGSGGNSARPDSKFYDICYPDQFIDVREYAKVLTPYEVDLIRDDKEENGVEEVVSFVVLGDGTTDIVDYTTKQIKFTTGINCSNINIGDDVSIIDYTANIIHKGIVYSVGSTYVSIKSYNQVYVGDSTFEYNHYIAVTKTKPILSSNTKLSIDLIGSPSVYPQIMKDRLASGVGIVGINPLLVSDTGVNLIPDGTSKYFKLSDKRTVQHSSIFTRNSGGSYSIGCLKPVNIVNGSTITEPTDLALLEFYTSKNNPYIQTTPKPVIEVLPKVKASNSHSVYKGALVGNQVAGKIQVGNGANGYESKVLENEKQYYDLIESATNFTYPVGSVVLSLSLSTYYTGAMNGLYVSKDGRNWGSTAVPFGNSSYFDFIGYYKPTHSTLALDNANSSASKWFETLEEGNNGVLAGVYGSEMVWDYTADVVGEFTDWTSSSTATRTAGTYINITDGNFEGAWYVNRTDSLALTNTNWIESKGKIYYNQVAAGLEYLTRWDGNGFGDDDTFEQLTNGTITDLNGNTCRTFHGSIALNGKVK